MSRAVILTALPVEYLAVRRHLVELEEKMHPQGTIYEQGKFVAKGQEWEVGIVEVGAGNAGTAVEAERAIAYFQPDILLFVGIAGGIKDVAIGDVVVATNVYRYESGKVGEQFFLRPNVGKSAYVLVQRAKWQARTGEWLQRLSSTPVPPPRVFVAPIIAGEKVVASRHSDILQFLRSSYNDAIAIEMEGFGFLSVAFAYPNIRAIVIRGISDLIEGKHDDAIELEEVRQAKASHHASAFAFQMLSKLEITSRNLLDNVSATNLQRKQQLEQRQEALQDECNLTSDKLKQLEWALPIESDLAVKFQLKQQIQELKQQIQELEQQIQELEQLRKLENDIDKIKRFLSSK
ncbi:MAG: 5'-methylthioadenosine/S-adenosylhomocysteine nucleosidase [Symploca sp. SIO2G7]|nr:5'-methylthioadenosine/S-adenosylhomocysteine nucleosidase [Symploca sp. SIO2G7]